MKILIVTTSPDNGSREDYSILYSGYLLVSSEVLSFSEPIFKQNNQYSHEQLIEEFKKLGYEVESLDPIIMEVDDQ